MQLLSNKLKSLLQKKSKERAKERVRSTPRSQVLSKPKLKRKERRIPYISKFLLQSIHLGLRLLRLALAPHLDWLSLNQCIHASRKSEKKIPPRAEIAGLLPSTEVMLTLLLPGTFE